MLNPLHHVMFLTSRMLLSAERRFCRPQWKFASISRRDRVNSGPWQPVKHGRALCWPSSQRANCCWQSHTWERAKTNNTVHIVLTEEKSQLLYNLRMKCIGGHTRWFLLDNIYKEAWTIMGIENRCTTYEDKMGKKRENKPNKSYPYTVFDWDLLKHNERTHSIWHFLLWS